jgi:exodeoxyribonuclease III
MRIISYNVNGIRAAMNKGFDEWLKAANPDVLCLQEIKAQEDQFPVEAMESLGYKSYLFPAQKKGYSGVAILSKTEPDSVQFGMGYDAYDEEGRYIQVNFPNLSVASVYFPSGTSGDARQDFKYAFLDDFERFAIEQVKSHPRIIFAGDVNICHKAIDIHNPVANKNSTGFLPEERAWVSGFLEKGFIDGYRHFFPDRADAYTWWSYRSGARNRNLGWRIDYHLISEQLAPDLKRADILSEAKHSDHCPILLELNS